jgi:hypothetical protein
MSKFIFFRCSVLIAALSAGTPCPGALVTNGGFEDVGGAAPGSPGPLTNWTVGDPANMFASSLIPHSGTWEAALGAIDPAAGKLSQNLTTTVGQSYSLVYWLYSIGDVPNTFSALWNGSTIAGSELTDDTSETVGNYKQFVFSDLEATATTTVLEFRATNEFGFWHLDDVSVTAVPEPATKWLAAAAMLLAALTTTRRRI